MASDSLFTALEEKVCYSQCFDLVKGTITLYFTIFPLPASLTALLLKPEIAFMSEILLTHIKSPENF